MLTSLVSHRICRRDLLESTHGPDGECRRLGRCSRGRRVAWARASEQRLPVPAATRGHAEAHLRARTSAGETLVAQRGSRLAREANPRLRPSRIRSPIWRCTRTSGSVTAWISPAVRPADCHLVSAATPNRFAGRRRLSQFIDVAWVTRERAFAHVRTHRLWPELVRTRHRRSVRPSLAQEPDRSPAR